MSVIIVTIGALMGFLCGGLYGLIFGSLAAFCIIPHYLAFQGRRPHHADNFFAVTYLTMGYLAKADGQVTLPEIRVAERMMHHMHLSAKLKRRAIAFFNEGKVSHFKLIIALLKRTTRDRQLLRSFIQAQVAVAEADGIVTPSEQKILIQLCHQLNFDPSEFGNFQSNQRQTPTPETSPYQILKIPTNANNNEVKAAYRKLIHQFHPDKLQAKELPEELLKFATTKAQEIQSAYQTICKIRNL